MGHGGGFSREGSMSAGVGPLGWTILSLAPLSQEGRQYGVLILGVSLNDEFAQMIAQATHNQISFCTSYQILASSWPAAQRGHVDLARVTESILTKQTIYINGRPSNLSSFYAPIKIVDEVICLVINADTTPITDFFKQQKNHLLVVLLLVLAATIIIGSGLTITIVRPLKKLQDRSLAAVKEFSHQDITFSRWGNENRHIIPGHGVDACRHQTSSPGLATGTGNHPSGKALSGQCLFQHTGWTLCPGFEFHNYPG